MKGLTISTFVGSSKEGLPVARVIGKMLNGRHVDDAVVSTRLWDDGGVFGLGEMTLDALREAIDSFTFAILVLTPDDFAQVRRRVVKLPRDNVLFELGLFMARLGPKRSLIVNCGVTKVPNDLAGLTIAKIELPKDRRTFRKLTKEEAKTVVKPAVEKIIDAMRKAMGDGPLERTVHYIAPDIDHSDHYNNFQVRLEAELVGLQVTWRFHPRRGEPYTTLRRVLKNSRPEDVVIFVPKGAFERENEKKLEKIIDANPGRALILFDQPAPDSIHNKSTVSFVGPDNDLVGRVAARIMKDLLSDKDLCRAEFFAIRGPGGERRAIGFQNAVKDLIDEKIKVKFRTFEDDDRTKNVRPTARIVKSLPKDKDVPVFLFAGNDESALALLEIRELETRNLCIVGCDATPAMRYKITPERLNIATIDTNLAEQAKRIRHIIEDQRWGEHDAVSPKAVRAS